MFNLKISKFYHNNRWGNEQMQRNFRKFLSFFIIVIVFIFMRKGVIGKWLFMLKMKWWTINVILIIDLSLIHI